MELRIADTFIVALLVHPAAAPAHAGISLPALAEQCDRLIELPRTPEAPMQCVESLIRSMASDATMIMGLETVRDALQSPELIRFGCALGQAPWKPAATGRPWPHSGRPAKGRRTTTGAMPSFSSKASAAPWKEVEIA